MAGAGVAVCWPAVPRGGAVAPAGRCCDPRGVAMLRTANGIYGVRCCGLRVLRVAVRAVRFLYAAAMCSFSVATDCCTSALIAFLPQNIDRSTKPTR